MVDIVKLEQEIIGLTQLDAWDRSHKEKFDELLEQYPDESQDDFWARLSFTAAADMILNNQYANQP